MWNWSLLLPAVGWMMPIAGVSLIAAEPSAAQVNRPLDSEGADTVVVAPPPRIAWDNSRVQGSPEPPPPFRGQRAFENLTFKRPVFVSREPDPPGRILVVEQNGKIKAFAHDAAVEQTQPFCEVDDHDTYSLCFHPDFATNRYVYVFANGPQSKAKDRLNKILRFEVSQGDEPRCLPESRITVIDWPSNGHNGGEMDFGPDGLLYISSGDGTSDSDGDLTGQDVSTLTSGVLRIDVDGAPPGKTYRIPEDNPFLKIPEARPELWAYGFRNPWRLRFDRRTGDLWVGDIGQDLWEMVIVVQRGANYGWSVMEGSHPFYLERRRGPTPISPPTIEHPHSEARSITGGFVYDGDRYPELRGVYLYGDYATGKVWGARYRNGEVSWQKELADTPYQILAFCQGPGGEIYLADYAGEIQELVPAPPLKPTHPFPRKLSETGLYQNVARNEVHPALIPYDVVAPLWSDGADKIRFIALPGEATIEYRPRGAWNFPEQSVLVKTFTLPVVDRSTGNVSPRRIETRLLLFQQGEWQGYSYAWNDEQTDAELVPAEGANVTMPVAAEGGEEIRGQTWRFPSRAECMVCHSRAAGFVLGLHTLQMNREVAFHGQSVNQLALLRQWDVLAKYKPPAKPDTYRLVDPADESEPVQLRARSYLHANCAQCHVEAGGGNSAFSIDIVRGESQMNLISAVPRHDRFGIPNAALIAPGAPERSILYHRLTTSERGRMPPLGSAVVDPQAASLIRAWILDLAPVEAPEP